MICADPERCQEDPTDGISRWYRCPSSPGDVGCLVRRRRMQWRQVLLYSLSSCSLCNNRLLATTSLPPGPSQCRRMWADPRFSGAAATRWAQLRGGVWSDATVQKLIADTAAMVRVAQSQQQVPKGRGAME